jgi:hypothetical protein
MARKRKTERGERPLSRDDRVKIESDAEEALRALVTKRPTPPKKRDTSGK